MKRLILRFVYLYRVRRQAYIIWVLMYYGLRVIRFENQENYRYLRYKNGWGI